MQSCRATCIETCIDSCIKNSGVQQSKRPRPKSRHCHLDLCRNDALKLGLTTAM